MSASDPRFEWAKLDLEVERTIEPVAIEHGPIALAYWCAMLIEAKTGERFGFIETSAKRFARRVFESRARVTLWQAFADEGLIELVEGSFSGRFIVRMHDPYFEQQQARGMTPADRAREYRNRKKAASPRGERHGTDVTERDDRHAASRERHGVVTQTETEDRDEEKSVPKGTSAKKRVPRIAALSGDQIEQQIDACRAELNGLSPFVDQLVDAAAGERKRGQVSAAVVLRELWLPITAMLEDTPRPAIRHGLEAAVRAGAPNARYVKKAATGYVPTPINAEANTNGASNGHAQQYAAADLTW